MSHAAVLKFIGNLGKGQFIVQQQLFHFFYFVQNDELLDGDSFYLRKHIR